MSDTCANTIPQEETLTGEKSLSFQPVNGIGSPWQFLFREKEGEISPRWFFGLLVEEVVALSLGVEVVVVVAMI